MVMAVVLATAQQTIRGCDSACDIACVNRLMAGGWYSGGPSDYWSRRWPAPSTGEGADVPDVGGESGHAVVT